MTGDAHRKESILAAQSGTQRERVSQRIDQLSSDEEQLRNAKPDLSLQEAARRPGLRLPQILEMFVEGYAARPALGW